MCRCRRPRMRSRPVLPSSGTSGTVPRYCGTVSCRSDFAGVLVMKLGLNHALGAVLLALSTAGALAQTPPSPDAPPANAAPLRASPSDAILLTVFLKHDQSKPLGQINEE